MFVELFSSFTGGLAIAITAIAAVLILRMFLKAKPRKEVLFLRPRDRRGETLLVTRETDRSIFCERATPIHRFIKLGPAYEFHEGGRLVTRFLGVEGTAYTADISNPLNPKPLNLSLAEVLQDFSWYKKLPEKFKNQVEKQKIGLVVNVEQPKADEHGLPNLTSDDVNAESDSIVLERLAQGTRISTVKREFYQLMVGIGLGMGIVLLLLRLGVL